MDVVMSSSTTGERETSPRRKTAQTTQATQATPAPQPTHTIPRKGARAERSCDTCRRRKLKCVRAKEQAQCVLCSFHERECTYLDEPQQRKRRKRAAEEPDPEPDLEPGPDTELQTEAGSGDDSSKRARTRATTRTARPDSPPRVLARPPSPPGPPSPAQIRRRMALGMHPTTHFKYIGPGSLHEDMLLDFIDPSFRYHNESDASKFCRVAEGVTFLARHDRTTVYSGDDAADTEAVEQLVRPHGPALVDLYFRIVHPSYPILHKLVFLEQYSTSPTGYRHFSAPLLAAIYLLAMDWWEYDQDLGDSRVGRGPRPDSEALAKLASRALMAVSYRPKLSTVLACLLMLQRVPGGGGGEGAGLGTAAGTGGASGFGSDSWVLTSQLVAVAEELGLHVDCIGWNIPAWEKGLRRRLAWAVFMQDKWSSLIYGRPSHVQASHWRIPHLTLRDFLEGEDAEADEADEAAGANVEGGTEIDKGRLLFIHLASLTEVMAEALETFYSHDPERYRAFSEADGMHTIELVKSVALRLRAWATALPSCLRMEAVRPRKLCSNGYLHLSYFVTEIMVYRCIVRSLERQPQPGPTSTPSSTSPPKSPPSPALLSLCREAAKTRLLHVMRFVEALRPEHLQAFWWFASAKSLTYICTYVSILWATSKGEDEAQYYRQKYDEFVWSLKVRARGVPFVTAALRDMGESLEEIDMSRPPFEQLADVRGARTGRRMAGAASISTTSTPVTETPSIQGESGLGSTAEGNLGGLPSGEPFVEAEFSDMMMLQTTPEFLSDFGVSASEAFFADINSLYLYTSGSQN